MKYLILVLVFEVVRGSIYQKGLLESIKQEKSCSVTGGVCTIAEDCPQGRLTPEKGLCPTQRYLGVECCYGLSLKDTQCRGHGGECISKAVYCNPRLMFVKATDCPEDTYCCILVKK